MPAICVDYVHILNTCISLYMYEYREYTEQKNMGIFMCIFNIVAYVHTNWD